MLSGCDDDRLAVADSFIVHFNELDIIVRNGVV